MDRRKNALIAAAIAATPIAFEVAHALHDSHPQQTGQSFQPMPTRHPWDLSEEPIEGPVRIVTSSVGSTSNQMPPGKQMIFSAPQQIDFTPYHYPVVQRNNALLAHMASLPCASVSSSSG